MRRGSAELHIKLCEASFVLLERAGTSPEDENPVLTFFYFDNLI